MTLFFACRATEVVQGAGRALAQPFTTLSHPVHVTVTVGPSTRGFRTRLPTCQWPMVPGYPGNSANLQRLGLSRARTQPPERRTRRPGHNLNVVVW
eukprot:2722884-Rhodomonas_salina.1